eukprot:19872-Heterococcus_DN1.PRE.5
MLRSTSSMLAMMKQAAIKPNCATIGKDRMRVCDLLWLRGEELRASLHIVMSSNAPITVRARPGQVITTKTDRPGVQVKAQADNEAAVGAAVRRICGVCSKAVAPYVCPRCHIAYCCGTCYRKHGEGCTEAFFRARVEDEIQAREREKQAALPADKRAETQRVADMLQRVRGAPDDEFTTAAMTDASEAAAADDDDSTA